MSAHNFGNSIWDIGTFDARRVRELAASNRAGALRSVVPPETGDVRIHADTSETAWLMHEIVGLGRLDAALGEEDGHPYIDIRSGDGVVADVVDVVATAIAEHHVSFATLCIGKRTLSLYPEPPDGGRQLQHAA